MSPPDYVTVGGGSTENFENRYGALRVEGAKMVLRKTHRGEEGQPPLEALRGRRRPIFGKKKLRNYWTVPK